MIAGPHIADFLVIQKMQLYASMIDMIWTPQGSLRNLEKKYKSGYDHQSVQLEAGKLSQNHRLRGSVSTVLTATGQVNGRWRILTPHRIETHEPTATKFRTIDYVRERTP